MTTISTFSCQPDLEFSFGLFLPNDEPENEKNPKRLMNSNTFQAHIQENDCQIVHTVLARKLASRCQ